jgi:hypothetical protein
MRFDRLKCRHCGCTTNRACPGGCSWVSINPPVCSGCQPPAGDQDNQACPERGGAEHAPLWLNRNSGFCLACKVTIIACEAA